MSKQQRFANSRILFHLLARKSHSNQAFTLIELLVVVVILGVLAAVGYQATINQIARANANTASNTATAVAKNCAALVATGDQAEFTNTIGDFLDTNVATLTGSACDDDEANTFQVEVGETFCRSATATKLADNQVAPAPDALAATC